MPDRRAPSERVKLLQTYIRLTVEISAMVWAVAALSNATNNIKEAQVNIINMLAEQSKAINEVKIHLVILDQTKKDK